MAELLHARDEAGPAPEDVSARARRAVAEAERRGVPPDPRAFAVFYAYLEGRDDRLIEAVDAALPPGGAPPLDVFDRLHDDHLAEDPRGQRFLQIGERIQRELGDLGASLARQAETDDAFIGWLGRAREGMSLFARPSAVKRTMRDLQESAQAHAEQTELFAAELARARRQIEELTAELHRVRESAYLDHLTGLANRRRLDVALEREIAAAGQGGERFSIVLADLDHFKRVNDEFGHGVGDSVLRQFARLLRQQLRDGDVAARYGGEEFALVLPAANLLAARHVAERLRQEFASRAFVLTGSRRSLGALTVSLGVAEHRAGETAASLLSRADAALYRAKRSGRNRVVAED